MIITNKSKSRLLDYQSKSPCNLDMFRIQPQFHEKKEWISKDGTKHRIVLMETSHLWHTFNMLVKVIKTTTSFIEESDAIMTDDIDLGFEITLDVEIANARDTRQAACIAIDHIGHELYLRKASVPELPSEDFRKYIRNRAKKLCRRFHDAPPVRLFEDLIMEDWYAGEFYKR